MVGVGPGGPEDLTPRARRALEEADLVIGYRTYVDLVSTIIAGKEVRAYPMKSELERAEAALDAAARGRQVALVSSGDPGIYGMAGPVLEMLGELPGEDGNETAETLQVEVIPGVTAASAAAALLGAPLMNDFAVISLSDLLTPWEVIARRLEAAAAGDLVIVLYNPASRKRTRQFSEAGRIIRRHQPGDTPVGIVRNARREEESRLITSLDAMSEQVVDMATTVIVGNSQTVLAANRMVTRRGYRL